MTTTRYATPDGWTVNQITLSDVGRKPSKKWDPAKHTEPRDYWHVTSGGQSFGYAPSPADLPAIAGPLGWDPADLAPVPTHVVLDTLSGHGGHVISAGEDGKPFGREDARAFAAKRNAGLKPGLERAHRVYALTEIDADVIDPGKAAKPHRVILPDAA